MAKSEQDLIAFLKKKWNNDLPPNVIEGIGDDCAVCNWDSPQSMLVTTDSLIENHHFKTGWFDHDPSMLAKSCGYKGLATSLSDIAAMGGTPLWAFVCLGLPKTIDPSWTGHFSSSFKSLAKEHNTLLLGGNLTSSDQITINVTLIGKADPNKICYRKGGKTGNVLCTNRTLGDAGGGMHLLANRQLASKLTKKEVDFLVNAFCYPKPMVDEGAFLASQKGVCAMMDLSDGIGSDVPKLAKSSLCGASIDLDALPLSKPLCSLAKLLRKDPKQMAICSGEDYGLLVSIDKDEFPKISAAYKEHFGSTLYPIGHLTKAQEIIPKLEGFDHFC